jgi:hypothetical protein
VQNARKQEVLSSIVVVYVSEILGAQVTSFSAILRQLVHDLSGSTVSLVWLDNLREASLSFELFMSLRVLQSSLKYYEAQAGFTLFIGHEKAPRESRGIDVLCF